MGSMTVAVSWSGYFGKLLKMFGLYLPAWLTTDPQTYLAAGNPGFHEFTSVFHCFNSNFYLIERGTKGAAKVNNFIVMLKVVTIIFVIVAGAFSLIQLIIGHLYSRTNGDY